MKVLTPIDRSARDGIVLPYGVGMAKSLGGAIAVVHVVSVTRSLVPGAMREAAAYVIAVEEGLREQGVQAEGIVQRGEPGPLIVAVADVLNVDMIVMASRQRSSLGKFVLGSVTDVVLANAHQPVVLLHETNGARADPKKARQAAYLAALVWNRQRVGYYTDEEAQQELGRLALLGLDRDALCSNYDSLARQGTVFEWLDLDFQLETLRAFFPEEVDDLVKHNILPFPETRAA